MPSACLDCGSRETLCTHLIFTVVPLVDKTWSYSVYCPACGMWSTYRVWE